MIQKNIDLKPFNTFGISANCDFFGRFSNEDELRDLLASNLQNPLMILGGGSNVLLTEDYHGTVLRNEILGYEIVDESTDDVIVRVGGGMIWHEFVIESIERGFGGVENLSLIPGSVGASPMQNIGAYGVEIKDVFHSLEAMEIRSGEIKTFNASECAFGYRESVFKRDLKGQYVITRVLFRLTKQHGINASYGAIGQELEKQGIENPTIRDISNAVIAIRQSKLPDPKEIGNAGSFFKNPVVDRNVLEEIQKKYEQVPNYPAENGKVKLAAGWLIEQAGWKGKTFDTYGVHKLQALVLVNYGGSTGKQVFDLSTQIIKDIKDKFGVELEREVNIY